MMRESDSRITYHASRFAFRRRGIGDHLAARIEHVDLLKQAYNHIRWLGANAKPIARAVGVDHQLLRLADRVIVPDDLDKLAVARRALVGDDDAIAGLFSLAGAP